MSKESEEVVTAITGGGDSNLKVCKISEEDDSQELCDDAEVESQTVMATINEGMLDNNTYNIMKQLTNENKSLWRIKNSYKNDAGHDNEIRNLWNFIEKDKEELVKLLTEKLRERL